MNMVASRSGVLLNVESSQAAPLITAMIAASGAGPSVPGLKGPRDVGG